MTLRTVAVVGGSLAGLRAVEALRRQGFDGRIVVVGAEAELPYDRPPLSKDILTGAWEPERTQLRKPESYAELAAEWRLGCAASGLSLTGTNERAVLLADGTRVPFDGLVIATGATPRSLPNTPPLGGIHVLRTLDDSLAIRAAIAAKARICVVGAGFIGAEVAASARASGCEVTLLEALPVPLERALGTEMGEYVAALHRDAGIDLRCGVGVEAFEGAGRIERVRLADGSVIATDCVVVGIGVAPATGWLEGTGLTLEDGVLCDAQCATSAPEVVACGDVARWHNPLFDETMRIEHWTNATEQADAAVARLLQGAASADPYAPVPYFWSDQHGVKIQFGGRARPDDEKRIVDGSLEDRRFVMLYGRKGRLTGVLGFSRPRLVMKYRRAIRESVSFESALAEAGV